MGKGKAKGWRPPSASDGASMLLGSADHLSGDSIASPVQLRDEGRALPKNHPNYGDEWGKGDRKGKGKGEGEASASGANAIPVVARPKEGWAPTVGGDEDRAKMPPPVLKASSKAPPDVKQAPPDVKQEPDPEPAATEVKVEEDAPTPAATKRSISPSKPVAKVEVKSEIEKRREAMLQREKEAASQQAEAVDREEDDPEARRRASEVRRREAEAASRAAEAKRRRDEDTARGENAAEEPATKRPKEENVDGKSGTGAIKQGLQGWAERVNSLAGDDPDLVRRCREFVRKRILKAHAGGHLHSHDWATEPVPTVEDLRCEG